MRRLLRSGEPFIWLTGGALALAILMIAGLVLLILVNGLGFFWPSGVERLALHDGSTALGQIRQREAIPTPGVTDAPVRTRTQFQIGNRDLYGQDFRWIDDDQIASRELPADAVVLERREWGHFFGFIKEIRRDGAAVAGGWDALQAPLAEAQRLWHRVEAMERYEAGAISARQERLRLALKRIDLRGAPREDRRPIDEELARLKEDYKRKEAEIAEVRREMARATVLLVTVDGKEKELPLAQLVRATRPNSLGFFGRCGVYASRLWEFVSGDPRESNTEGGVLPAIFGTVMMVFVMTLAVVPLGVLAALYLREYARQGPLVRAVRIAVNNLAGVPSIVFGVFGLGFFVYGIGGRIDSWFFPESLPTPTFGTGGILWASLTLALLTVPTVIVAAEEGLAAVPSDIRQASLALGATKFETMWRVVIPSAAPGILTGMILAMARAAGEVAPLMITGVVKLAPTLPLDGTFPCMHFDRKFMHLGFHIYDVGFQSPNVEAARPMVYMTTLLLLIIVVMLNFTAIVIRNRLRRKYKSAAF